MQLPLPTPRAVALPIDVPIGLAREHLKAVVSAQLQIKRPSENVTDASLFVSLRGQDKGFEIDKRKVMRATISSRQ
jgi:hypothetical protein